VKEGLLERKEDPERSATARSIGHSQASAMRQYDRVTDCQAEPIAWHTGANGFAGTNEWPEDVFAVCRRDARTSIFHKQQHLVGLRDAGRDINRSVRRRVLDGVLQQIGQGSLHLAGMDVDRRHVCRDVAADHTACQESSHPANGPVDECRRVYHIQWVGPARLAGSVLDEQREKVGHPVGFNLNIREQVAARVCVPLDVGTT
jgi:hypothetical protein